MAGWLECAVNAKILNEPVYSWLVDRGFPELSGLNEPEYSSAAVVCVSCGGDGGGDKGTGEAS